MAIHWSLTHASIEIGISDAAVSQRIKSLEKYLGAKLYEARGGKVRLTEVGNQTKALAQRIFVERAEGEEEIRGPAVPQNFSRSMSIRDAMDLNLLLCYEVNGEPLPVGHGRPLRLVAPGWYGVANVKWLTRIEVRDTRLMNRFMARDYVTLREE